MGVFSKEWGLFQTSKDTARGAGGKFRKAVEARKAALVRRNGREPLPRQRISCPRDRRPSARPGPKPVLCPH
ncbi:hypothetical protein DIZ27_32570 [Streptomyces sp. NWU339]|nr:hypothetical protein DIZ27_32570 [Streptomyces sp. NWU339]